MGFVGLAFGFCEGVREGDFAWHCGSRLICADVGGESDS